MTVARVTEISAESPRSFEDAMRQGIRRANATLRNVSGAWVKEQQLAISDGRITAFRVNMLVTFVLDEPTRRGRAAAAPAAPARPAAKKAAARKSTRKTARGARRTATKRARRRR
jgi:hypothetical protein